MLTQKKILFLFNRMNEELAKKNEIGEIGIVGGTVMCLVHNARNATKDVDAIFAPSQIIRKIAKQLAEEEGLPTNWLNDGAKNYLQPNFERQEVLALTNLRVWAPEPRYMLAMKCISARWDTNDKDDVIFLIKLLKIKKSSAVLKLIENYYPKKMIPAKTSFFIEELFE